jgi:hypothetical protein
MWQHTSCELNWQITPGCLCYQHASHVNMCFMATLRLYFTRFSWQLEATCTCTPNSDVTLLAVRVTYLPCTYPPATRIICISQTVDATSAPCPYIMTSSHIHSTSLRKCFLSVTLWRARSRGQLSRRWTRLRGRTEGSTCTAVSHACQQVNTRPHVTNTATPRREKYRAQQENPADGVAKWALVPRSTTAGRPYMMAAGPLCHMGGLGSCRPSREPGGMERERSPPISRARLGTVDTKHRDVHSCQPYWPG